MAVADKVKEIIVEQLGVDESQVDDNASFVDDLGPIPDIVELVMAFEEAFDMDILTKMPRRSAPSGSHRLH
jgi:acyl carrier protein